MFLHNPPLLPAVEVHLLTDYQDKDTYQLGKYN